MGEVSETHLPGVGVRYEFLTEDGDRLGVIVHRGGRREVLAYDPSDPDICTTVMRLSVADTRTLSELLGASRVNEVTTAVQQEIEGLAIEWMPVGRSSTLAGQSIADSDIRARTGVSIVAVIRDGQTFAAPGPDFTLVPGDLTVVVGTLEGLEVVRGILGG